jgi:hypothetical protein
VDSLQQDYVSASPKRDCIFPPIDLKLTIRFPGVQFYLSCWYKRNELGFRSALFFSAAAFSGAFGGLLAAGIANLNGVAGLPGWAWIVSPSFSGT